MGHACLLTVRGRGVCRCAKAKAWRLGIGMPRAKTREYHAECGAPDHKSAPDGKVPAAVQRKKMPRVSGAFDWLIGRRSVHGQRGRCLLLLDCGYAGLHRLLHLLEGAHLDPAHALARDAELARQIFERDRVVGQPARLEDAALALSLSTSSLPVFSCPPGKLFATSQMVLWNLGAGLSNLSAVPAGRVAEMGRA